MAKIRKRSIDSIKRAPVRKNSYEAPIVRRKKRPVPKEYQSLKKAKKKRGGCLWIIFLLFLATFAGFIYWNNQGGEVIDKSLELKIDGPDKIVSGDQVIYTINYNNLDKVVLEKMELSVQWPSGFYFDEASIEPFDENATTWILDNLSPNQESELEIKGQLVGQKDDELITEFILNYQPENFTSDFSEEVSIETKITDNILELNIEGIDKTLVDEEREFKVKYINTSDEALTELYLDILNPDDFDIISIEPEKEEDYWIIALEPGEEKEIILKGSFSSDSKPNQSLVVEIGNMVNDDFRRLARAEKNILVINPEFDISLETNGEVGNQTLNWSDIIRYQLEITNNSGTDITDVQITALLDGLALDWDSLETVGLYEESKVIWTKEEDDSLAIWKDGDKKTLTWQIKVVDEPIADRMIDNIIKVNIQGLESWEQVETSVLLTVGEGIIFNNGIYWDLGGRTVGSGLLPPQAGEETNYLAVWSLPEATGDFTSMKIESILPPQVSFVEETDVQAGELVFDEETRNLVWNITDFDNTLLPLTSSFIIQLIPTEDDIGSAIVLLNSPTLIAEGTEDIIIRSKSLKTSDVYADSNDPIGIVE